MTVHPASFACDCCVGRDHLTPEDTTNRPGLPALRFRVGTHSTVKETMLAALSEWPALDGLTTRSDDDPSIGLIDAWATVLDVLTFYQERIANEGYLATATESRSIHQLAAALAYVPSSAVAAETYLAFEMETAPGAPSELEIEAGSQVQSVPGQGEKPQIFETISDLHARQEWNAMATRRSIEIIPQNGHVETYLAGVATGISVGDGLLFVSHDREQDQSSTSWAFRRVSVVEPDLAAGVTRVGWKEELTSLSSKLETAGVNVYAMRTQAAVFGHNAPDIRLMPQSVKDGFELCKDDNWPFVLTTGSTDQIDLDATYQNVLGGSWTVLSSGTDNELFDVTDVAEVSRQDYTLVAKVSRLSLATKNPLAEFKGGVRDTSVFVESERRELGAVPITSPVVGRHITLDDEVPPLDDQRVVMVTGRRAMLAVARDAFGVDFVPADGSASRALAPGEELVIQAAPTHAAGTTTWTVQLTDGTPGAVTVNDRELADVEAGDDIEVVSEQSTLEGATAVSDERTTLVLAGDLAYAYDRSSCRVLANVTIATHGDSKREVLGSGDASLVSQRFTLSDSPLTYVPAQSPTGAATTLTVRVNEEAWQEVDSLYGQGNRDRVVHVDQNEDGTVRVTFGDGIEGARPPTGNENITAEYRVGAGREGMLAEGQLSLLKTRPLGLKGVTNPLAPEGGADAESRDQTRTNAPLTVLTFDRIVSVTDYEDFARQFPGVAKVRGETLWDGSDRILHLTIAGTDGEAVGEGSTVHTNLTAAILNAGGHEQRFKVDTFELVAFDVTAGLFLDTSFDPDTVVAEVTAAIAARYRFEERQIASAVTVAEVAALAQGVAGVAGVDVDVLAVSGGTGVGDVVALAARSTATGVAPAQLLALHPAGPKVVVKS